VHGCLTTAIGAVAKRGQQQRHVVVLARIADAKADDHAVEEAVPASGLCSIGQAPIGLTLAQYANTLKGKPEAPGKRFSKLMILAGF